MGVARTSDPINPDNNRMSLTRRRIGHLSAMMAAFVLGSTLLATATLGNVRLQPGPEPAYAVDPQPSPGVLPTSGAFSTPVLPGRIGVATAPISLRYTFDGGVDQSITDGSGGHQLRALGQNGGTLSLVPKGSGLAVAYPQRCTLARERDCPRAILEGMPDDALNPGTRRVQYGASILMTHADLADGANIVQKGYSVGGVSQFKLQVDHRQGHPSCVITGNQAHIYRAEPRLDVADGHWHDLACLRTSNRLTILVDGVERAWVPLPRGLRIANAEPLRVGGKGPNKSNDQFAGEIDDVFLTIS
jgi:concanavalin A-like lectin/glucanase superfamily protein